MSPQERDELYGALGAMYVYLADQAEVKRRRQRATCCRTWYTPKPKATSSRWTSSCRS